MISRADFLTLFSLLAHASCMVHADNSTVVWFDKPGKNYGEATVKGNGRLGAMDLGGMDVDRIVLNESSMWSGGPYEANRGDAFQCLPEVREKFFAGDYDGAGSLLSRNFGYATIRSGHGTKAILRIGDREQALDLKAGKIRTFDLSAGSAK